MARGFVKEERKAKQYIRAELEEYNPPIDLPIENRIEGVSESFNKILEEARQEVELTDKQLPLANRYDVLKHRLVNMYCSGNYTLNQLARVLGVSINTVCRWLRLPDVKEMIEKMQIDEDIVIASSIKALRNRAVERAAELLDSDNDMVASIMVRDVLDRTGHKAVEKKQVDVTLTYEQRIQMLYNGDSEKPVDNTVENVDYSIDGEGSNEQINTEGEDKGD